MAISRTQIGVPVATQVVQDNKLARIEQTPFSTTTPPKMLPDGVTLRVTGIDETTQTDIDLSDLKPVGGVLHIVARADDTSGVPTAGEIAGFDSVPAAGDRAIVMRTGGSVEYYSTVDGTVWAILATDTEQAGLQLATDAEFTAGTETTKPPSVKQVVDADNLRVLKSEKAVAADIAAGTADKWVDAKEVKDVVDALNFVGLTDTPNDLTGLALQIMRVNAAEDAIEAVALAASLVSFDNATANLAGAPATSQAAIEALKALLDEQPTQVTAAVQDNEVTLIDVDASNNALYPFSTSETWAQVKANYTHLRIMGNVSVSGSNNVKPYSFDFDPNVHTLTQGMSGARIDIDSSHNGVTAYLNFPSDTDTGLTYRQSGGDSPANGRMQFKVVGIKKTNAIMGINVTNSSSVAAGTYQIRKNADGTFDLI